jgi:hypothetical protein
MNNQFYDVTLEQNDKLGFYQVGDTKYHSKVQALIHGTRTNQFPQWNFNNKVYAAQNWTQEPQINLKELYRLRALQLREKYDYIRLECSGGSDSTQTLFSFLLNGIHIDEVIFRYPKAGGSSVPVDSTNYNVENTLSEAEFATRPLLQWVQVHYPRVKITIHDYSEDMIKQEDRDESWVYAAKDFLQPAHVTKFPNYQPINQRIIADSGKKICVLYGIDKPKMCIRDGKWYLYFIDFQANYANPDIGEYNNITNEYFFWSPDLPEISVKQAHLVRKWFNLPVNQDLQHLVRWPNHSNIQRTTYESLVKPLVYPDYDPLTFQVCKPATNFYSEMDFWFYDNFKDHKLYNSWIAGINFVERNIDKKYFNVEFGRAVGFVGFLSPFYYIGDAITSNGLRTKFDIALADRF